LDVKLCSVMSSERKAILERYAWDRTQDEEELLIRAMMYHNPVELLTSFSREELKKTFLENLHRFDDKNLNFWKFALEVSDEEFNRYAEGNFRFGLRKVIG
jgi:hypothetical protein